MSSNYLSQNVQQKNINLRVNDLTTRGTIYVDNLTLPYSSSKIDMGETGNIECSSSSTGTKIATAADQKVSFHGQNPSTQHSSTGEITGFTSGGSNQAYDNSTYTGNVGSSAYTVGDVIKCLKIKGLLAE